MFWLILSSVYMCDIIIDANVSDFIGLPPQLLLFYRWCALIDASRIISWENCKSWWFFETLYSLEISWSFKKCYWEPNGKLWELTVYIVLSLFSHSLVHCLINLSLFDDKSVHEKVLTMCKYILPAWRCGMHGSQSLDFSCLNFEHSLMTNGN